MRHNKFIVIKGLTHKTKNRVRNHGEGWIVLKKADANKRMVLLQEIDPKDVYEPYCFWGEIGMDFEVVK